MSSVSAIAQEFLQDFRFDDEVRPLVTGYEGDLYSRYHVVRRDGSVVAFEPHKIMVAVTKAFLDIEKHRASVGVAVHSSRIKSLVAKITADVVSELVKKNPTGGSIHIESVQDTVERVLMGSGEYEVARAYIIYRERHAQERERERERQPVKIGVVHNGVKAPLDLKRLKKTVAAACAGLEEFVSVEAIIDAAMKNLYDGVSKQEVSKSLILAARTLIETDPSYTYVTARLLLGDIRAEVLGLEASHEVMRKRYANYFKDFIKQAVRVDLLSKEMLDFDLQMLGKALEAERDMQFDYLGLQTLYDRYFLHHDGQRIELPQAFFMRVAMGLALNEENKNERAIEFYKLLSSFDFMSSTPTLFNSGTIRSQLSSCYLTTVADDLDGIYESIKDNALLSKFAGGLGNDWTRVRAMGAHIKGTNGKSQGVVPFLKVVNDTAVAVNQGGKRKGAVCAYLETWHLDVEEFLDLRKNTGDDRRRTHDMNTANWIPDLFMKRVHEGADWTLFSPNDVPDLHDLFGSSFEKAYVAYEAAFDRGEIKNAKRIPALSLWRKMLTMLFETGHPWITFKDPCNIRSPQQHKGVVHSSNLCTEITLNTNDEEIAVCNLGSVNLASHLKNVDGVWSIDREKLRVTVRTAMRMLDNVIDINYYAVEKAKTSNARHRPVGMGMMAFQDALHKMRVPYASEQAVQFADEAMEAICYYAYEASSDLASERGVYESYGGSLWSRGVLPLDSLRMLQQERGEYLQVDTSSTMDWDGLRKKISQQGMRNSNCVAIAPTATISNIINVSASIEPAFQNLFVKSNLGGEFTMVNEFMVRDLKARGIWDPVMVNDIKYFDGSLSRIDRVPADLKALYATAFEVDPKWLIEAASRRQKWIDQAQSLNIYMAGASGKKLDETYRFAWLRGLKTTYYLRTLSASSAEKSTGRGGELNAVPQAPVDDSPASDVKFCSIDNPDCEACQ